MTDKEKIRAKIEKLREIVYLPCNKKRHGFKMGFMNAIDEVIDILNSMQEEPKFKVGDTIRSSDAEEVIVCEVRDNEYLCDEGGNYCIVPFNKQDQWKIVEYPVSEDLEEYIYKQLNEGCIECGDIERFIEGMKNYMKGE